MITVIDTNAAVEMALGLNRRQIVADMLVSSEWVVAPSIYLYEIANVLWKYHRLGAIPKATLGQRLTDCAGLVDEYLPAEELYAEAFTYACQLNHSAYDMAYLLACLRKKARLLSFDSRLLAAAATLKIECCQ